MPRSCHLHARLEHQVWAQTWGKPADFAALSLPHPSLRDSEPFWNLIFPQEPHPRVPPTTTSAAFPLPARSHLIAVGVSHLRGSFAKPHPLGFLPRKFCRSISAHAEIPDVPQESLCPLTLLSPRWHFVFHSERHLGLLFAGKCSV